MILHALERLRNELARTGVISDKFKDWLNCIALDINHEAYDNGKKAGIKEARSKKRRKAKR